MPPLDHDRCYAAALSRDARFDGTFIVAVRTTGIYCRPSCPAVTPKRTNVEFHHTAAAAQQRGFRACKRCLPDATPGSPEWNVRQDLVGRAMRLIADGLVEREGVGALAASLGYSERHLNRLLTDEVGAGPLAVARAQRAQTSRTLIETTDLALTDVAFAAGFGSVRQFNDTIRAVFDATPTGLRQQAHTRGHSKEPGAATAAGDAPPVTLRLPTREPFAGSEVMSFLALRAIPGVEAYDLDGDERAIYRRVISLSGGPAVISLQLPHDDADRTHVVATLQLSDIGDLATAVQRIRRMLDLDADPAAVDEHLARTPGLGRLVRATPGRRAPGSVDPFETLIRAIIGQQISVAGARTVANRLVEAVSRPLAASMADAELTHAFPTPTQVADAPDDAFSMPTARRDTLRRAAAAIASGDVSVDVGIDPVDARRELLALKGIGPWTADYMLMRGFSHPDIWLGSDLGVIHACRDLGIDDPATAATDWAPWRSYAVHHLWASLSDVPPKKKTSRKQTS